MADIFVFLFVNESQVLRSSCLIKVLKYLLDEFIQNQSSKWGEEVKEVTKSIFQCDSRDSQDSLLGRENKSLF